MLLPRKRWPWIVAAVVAAVVLAWFQPQKLLIDDRVEDALPTREGEPEDVVADRSGPAAEGDSPAGPQEIARGDLVSLDHSTSGVARVLDTGGATVLRLEGLETDNGPDLYVYLTTNPASGDEGAFDDDHLNLGRLKGNLGDQNYDVPAGTDLSRYRSVVIWCDRFNSAFGAADLSLSS